MLANTTADSKMAEKPGSKLFTPQEFDALTRYFVGNLSHYRENLIIPRSVGPIQIKSDQQKQVEAFFESCAFKAIVATVGGNSCLNT